MSDTQKVQVLVADDDPNILVFFQAIMVTAKLHLLTARTGHEALRKAQDRTIHLAFLDVKMPDMSGLDTLIEWKKLQPETQVVMISSYSDGMLVRQAIQNGAFTYLFKPLNKMDVLSVTVKCLKKLGIEETLSF